MSKLTLKPSGAFIRDLKRARKRRKNLDKLNVLIELLINQEMLPMKNRDHKLQGNFKHCRECHIEPDWLLIYQVQDSSLLLHRTGTHTDLFE